MRHDRIGRAGQGQRGRGGTLHSGDRVPVDETFNLAATRIDLGAPSDLVHLQFRRFAGCPVCSLHLRSFSRRRSELSAAGIREVAVFHSRESELRKYLGEFGLEFVADPGKRLYAAFGVGASPRALLDPRAWPAIAGSVAVGLLDVFIRRRPMPPLSPEGGSIGLPADFLIGRDGRIAAAHYGAHADDHWSVDEVLALARTLKSGMP